MKDQHDKRKRIAILGAGPSGLYLYKHLLDEHSAFSVEIFEAKAQLGSGMPYSALGASAEHITNVSCNEIPPLDTPILEWLEALPVQALEPFSLEVERFHEHKVLPRLLFGDYLANQFETLLERGRELGIPTKVHFETTVVDVADYPASNTVVVTLSTGELREFDYVVICTGHNWPTKHEGQASGWFDSPYPPLKLAHRHNHSVAIRGSSLTAVDAIRTLSRYNGTFEKDRHDRLCFEANADSPDFRIVMHSLNGLLPCIRFHTDTPEIGKGTELSREEIDANMAENDGFLSLDFMFDRTFKEPLRDRDPKFYERIKDMSIETFVDDMLSLRDSIEPFALFKGEYTEADKSIRREESIYWKEMLSALSFAMNYPAKHMSAEDMVRHRRVLMPLISIVIAFVPQSSAEELIALHDAGRLDLVAVSRDSVVEPSAAGGCIYRYTSEAGRAVETAYPTFVDCIGQPHLPFDAFPFKSLLKNRIIIPARLRFRSAEAGARMQEAGDSQVERDDNGEYSLRVAGLAINDCFQVIGTKGDANPRIYMMAVPYIGGYNPDYSGLDFCEEAGGTIVEELTRRATA